MVILGGSMFKLRASLVSLAVFTALSATAQATQTEQDKEIEVITVTSDFKLKNLQTFSGSAHVFSAEEVANRNAVHIETLLNSAANVNFTAGASRGRFVQIRGVGMRSQFVDPITPSVGVIIDGINYSGLGGSALLFDTQQAEIYRGPQGTQFGADALAGLIHIKTAEASTDVTGQLHLSAGNYNSTQTGVAVGGGIDNAVALRGSVYHAKSDGYVDNQYLNKPTQDQDELVARFKAKSDFSDTFHSELTVHYIDINNGYDGFTLDNSRKSVADNPGQDTQESYAFALNNSYTALQAVDVQLNLTALNADTLYSYDEDWVCNDEAQPKLCEAGLHDWGYSSTDAYQRDRQVRTAELVLSGKQAGWIIGSYYKTYNEQLTRAYTWQEQDFTADFSQDSVAVFGQLETVIDDRTKLVSGLRAESYDQDYQNANSIIKSTNDTMFGGKLALEHQVNEQAFIYTSLSRGYKVGGVNGEALAKAKDEGVDQGFFDSIAEFEPEYLWNAEFGVKGRSKDNSLVLRLTGFYMYRDNMQLKAYKEYKATVDSEPVFIGYNDNAGSGRNYGFELDSYYQLTDRIGVTAAVGYLRSRINDFVTSEGVNMDGREQAQAPRYTYSLGARFDATDKLYIHMSLDGKDDYYFSDSHFSRADSSTLVNAKIAYQLAEWELSAYVRNMFNQDTQVRGFEFGNDPRDYYESHTYVQYGEPRVAGVSVSYQF
jgi:iron complex outermembrane receptor protein